MTDAVDTKILGQVAFEDGINLELVPYEENTLLVIAVSSFAGEKPLPMRSSNGDQVALRIRFGRADPRGAAPDLTYRNSAKLMFWNSKEIDSGSGGPLAGFALAVGMFKVGGEISDVYRSDRILLEVPLTNGSDYVFDLDPGDVVFHGFVETLLPVRPMARAVPNRVGVPPSPSSGGKPVRCSADDLDRMEDAICNVPEILAAYVRFRDLNRTLSRSEDAAIRESARQKYKIGETQLNTCRQTDTVAFRKCVLDAYRSGYEMLRTVR